MLSNWTMKPLTLEAGQFWAHMFPWKIRKWMMHVKKIICELRIRNQISEEWSSQLWSQFLHIFHIFRGKIWTQNWPTPFVSGFIAQLVEHRNREVTGSSPVEVLNFFHASLRNCKNCDHNCDDHSSLIWFHIWLNLPKSFKRIYFQFIWLKTLLITTSHLLAKTVIPRFLSLTLHVPFTWNCLTLVLSLLSRRKRFASLLNAIVTTLILS